VSAARRLIVLMGLVAVAVALVLADPTALCVLPALLLFAPLLLRRYPGERLLAAVRGERRPRRAELAVRAPRRRPLTLVPRGGLLIARSLAVRPPPPLPLAAAG
jgi:hypothetical protein